jgi:hypothetical protein
LVLIAVHGEGRRRADQPPETKIIEQPAPKRKILHQGRPEARFIPQFWHQIRGSNIQEICGREGKQYRCDPR